MAEIKPPSTPPAHYEGNKQHSMFGYFLGNSQGNMSNTVEVWQSIPKYFLTPAQVAKLRTAEGLAQPYKHDYGFKDKSGNLLPFSVKIQPALIEQEDGTHKAFFPGATEEILEEALTRIFSDQQQGIHIPEKLQSWVKFSYGMLRKELQAIGHSRSLQQIKHAIEIMTMCHITVSKDGNEIYRGSILSDYFKVDREKYLNDSDNFHYVRLPVFISEAVNNLNYRQFNYSRLMSCNLQLTRWFYHRLVNRFTNASIAPPNTYHFAFSSIKRESALLRQSRDIDNRRKVIDALEELTNAQVIFGYEIEEKRVGKKIIDIIYTLNPSHHFASEQKDANQRKVKLGSRISD